MHTETNWNATNSLLPPEGEVVWTLDSGGYARKLIYKNNLWWFDDMSMYVYFIPVFWKPVEDGPSSVSASIQYKD